LKRISSYKNTVGRGAGFGIDVETGTTEVSEFSDQSHDTTSYCEPNARVMKYTNHQFMTHETCYFSADYESELKSLEDPANMSNMTKVVQFPFTVPVSVSNIEG